jgi:hypothetical protein
VACKQNSMGSRIFIGCTKSTVQPTRLSLSYVYKTKRSMKSINFTLTFNKRGSSVSIVTRLRGGRLRFDSRQEQRNFLFASASRPALGSTQTPIQWVTGALFPGLKRPGCEADYSPPSRADVKNSWRYTFSPIHLRGMILG